MTIQKIRPVVLGLAYRNQEVLVEKGYDSIKKETFYRFLGGGIEFQETATTALKREFVEEIDCLIEVKGFVTFLENIFEYEGMPKHELVFVYEIQLSSPFYDMDTFFKSENGEKTEVAWLPIASFKQKEWTIYPLGILDYL